MEVAVRLDAAVGEDGRVVDRGFELAGGDGPGVGDRVAEPPRDLRGAAERVGVLHDAVAVAVARDDRRPREQRAQVGGRDGLARLGAQSLEVRREDPVGAELALDGHRCGEVGGVGEPVEIVEREDEHPEHPVGAVDEGQPLLLAELDGSQPVLDERLSRGPDHAVVDDVPLPHERERAVREGREVARAAEAPVLVDDGHEAAAEQGGVGVGGLEPDAGAAGREGREPQEHERADDLVLDARPGARGVRADEAALQPGAVGGGDVPGREGAEPGRDPVDGLLARGQAVDDGA